MEQSPSVVLVNKWQPHPKYKANSGIREQSFNRDDWGRVAPWRGAERGPVDGEGVRRTKSKHSTSGIRGQRVGPGRLVCL